MLCQWRVTGSLAFLLLISIATLAYLWKSSYYDLSRLLPLSFSKEILFESSHKITIIAIWNPRDTRPIYLPNFFASAKANTNIDFLFIVVDKHNTGQCHQPIPHRASNIKEICLSVEEYQNMHADFLCNHWGCDGHDRTILMAKLNERYPDDNVNSYFRPFRSAIFAKWVDPNTKIWGWCDMDVMFGNFTRAFPWDVMEDFDIMVAHTFPVHPADRVLLYLPGHLTFFRNSGQVTAGFLAFPNFQNLNAFLHEPWLGWAAEEIEYSNFAFYHSNFTFLFFPGLVYTRLHAATSESGVYVFERGKEPLVDLSSSAIEPQNAAARSSIDTMISRHEQEWMEIPTFSPAGIEYAVELREGAGNGSIWFSKHSAIDFVTDYSKILGHGRRYVVRREPGGPVYDREEPNTREMHFSLNGFLDGDVRGSSVTMLEGLYTHFQYEKYSTWWSLPKEPLSKNEVLYVDKGIGLEIWNLSGDVIFKASGQEETDMMIHGIESHR